MLRRNCKFTTEVQCDYTVCTKECAHRKVVEGVLNQLKKKERSRE